MLESVRHNLTRLMIFHGRSTRREFWPFAVLVAAVFLLASGYLMAHGIVALALNPDALAGQPIEAMVPHIEPLLLRIGGLAAVAIVLLASAVARRLHDAGLSGWWALIPIFFLATGSFLFRNIWFVDEYLLQMFAILVVNNFLYVVSLIGLMVVLWTPTGTPAFGKPA